MVAQQRNVGRFTYVDNSGQSWNKRGELDAIRNAVDGSAASGAHPEWGAETKRHSVRKGLYTDGTTFRSKTIILYTAAAAAALTPGTSTLSFMVEGETVAVVYTYAGLIAEKQPKNVASRNLADHA
jgi:hypothetical protein